MVLTATHYDEKNKRIILSYDAKEYIDKLKIGRQGLHFANTDSGWTLAIYVNPVTQARLNKTKEFIQNECWQVVVLDSLFVELGHPELVTKTSDEKVDFLFKESTYDKCAPIFTQYKYAQAEPNWFNWVDKDLRREVISKVSKQLYLVTDNEQESIVHNVLAFNVGEFVKTFIDDGCEIARTYHDSSCTINDLYFYYGERFVNWLDILVRRHYIKVLMKKRKHTTLSPAALPTEQVLNYLYTEIPVMQNEAMKAMIRLLHEKDIPPIERADVYQSLIDASFRTRRKNEQILFSQFAAAEKKDRYEVECLLSPLIFK